MSNYTKPERPDGVPRWVYLGAEHINGTGQTLMWVEDERCEYAGGGTECCTGEAHCQVKYMSWQEMNAIGMWMIEQADVARDVQLREG